MASLIDASALEWPIVAGSCGDTGPEGITVDQWAAAQDAAVRWLWALSGRQFGTWTVTFRPEWTTPVPQPRPPWMYGGLYATPWLSQGNVLPLGWAGPARPAPVASNRITLPGPVQDVESVMVDGAVVDASLYEPQGDDLVRIDDDPWPISQDTTKPVDEAGSWQIVYTRGRDVPLAGQQAAGVLACELAAAVLGDDDCQLPNNVTQVTRNGVTISMQADEITQGFTGIAAVDQWARTVNPNGLRQPPAVWSPDLDPNLLPTPAVHS